MRPRLTRIGIRSKLILLFVVLKLIPLLLLAGLAWQSIGLLGQQMAVRTERLTNSMQNSMLRLSKGMTDESTRALDLKSRDALERLTTDTAQAVADFLHDRDRDALLAATLQPSAEHYRQFIDNRRGRLIDPGQWQLAKDGESWERAAALGADSRKVLPANRENNQDFNYRPPASEAQRMVGVEQPLYHEMTFVGLDGQEIIKVSTSDVLPRGLRNVSLRQNTYARAERYFSELKKLKPGELYVSDVIGPYVKSRVIGNYTPSKAQALKIPFRPELEAYAGKENPNGKQFQGIVRWATPVVRGGQIIGYVTLALDHRHITRFTDNLMPTDERYTAIPNASNGNYAFMWDYLDRNIAHPRHQFIVGVDPATGDYEVPWLEDTIYQGWRASGKPIGEYLAGVTPFDQQSRTKVQAAALLQAGTVGLDCRYVNSAPQCQGWKNLTEQGGSGSFAILWSGVWKLTTAAAIPYHTGRYGKTPRGFGYVTIGANIDEFHLAATQTKVALDNEVQAHGRQMRQAQRDTHRLIEDSLQTTVWRLAASTLVMVIAVVLIAIWLANLITRNVTRLTDGLQQIERGDLSFRIAKQSDDEMGALASAINRMADAVELSMNQRDAAFRELSSHKNQLEDLVSSRTAELKLSYHSLDQALSELELILENASLGIAAVSFDTHGQRVITRTNLALERMLGYNRGELDHQNTRILHYDEDHHTFDHIYQEIIRHGLIYHGEHRLVRKDGQRIEVDLTGSAINPQHLSRGTVWLFEDVTERKKVKEELVRTKESAEAATLAKSYFLANMSHEIRTPMNAVIGMSRLCLGTDLQPQQREYVEKVFQAGQSLLGIINDILDSSKIEAGKMALEAVPFPLRQVFENLANFTAAKADEKHLELLFNLPPELPYQLIGDPLRLGQVLLNLVDNAIKFTAEGEIRVTVTELTQHSTDDNVVLEFRVEDTGIGMTAEQCSRLFMPFSQADTSTTRKYGGSGLGLSICRSLVELMGGSVRVMSAIGVGSTLAFTARFGRASQQLLPQKVLYPDLQGLKVLVVDDIASARLLMTDMLQSFAFRVTCVESGQAALAALEASSEEDPYRLVLMDWIMPEMDGIEASKRIKAHPKLAAIPTIIMVTAHGREMIMEQAADAQLDGFLVKPVAASTLLDTIMSVFGKNQPTLPRGNMDAWKIKKQPQLHGCHVLLVEDHGINQQIARELLTQAGLQVTVANNGQEAVARIEREVFDAVLMDIQMPVMDGYEATRIIRGMAAGAHLPIFAMTANAMLGDREKSLMAGMNDHLIKPIDPNELFKALSTWVQPANDPPDDLVGSPAADPAELEQWFPDPLPGIDLGRALGSVGGNARLLHKLLVEFFHDHHQDAEHLRIALEQGDLVAVQHLAHTLKGVASSLGAPALQSAAQALDSALKSGADDHCPTLLVELAAELSPLMAGLQRLVEHARGADDGAPVETNLAAAWPMIQTLEELLAKNSPKSEQQAEHLCRLIRSGAARDQCHRLLDHLAEFDFEGAKPLLAKLKKTLGEHA